MLAVALLGWPAAGSAHESQSSTRVIVQVGEGSTELLVLYEVGAGTQAQVLRTVHDGDLDGVLDEGERTKLAARLSNDALYGLTVTRDGEVLEASDMSWRLELQPEGDGAVLVALWVELARGGAGRYAVSLSEQRPSVTVELEAGTGLRTGAAVSAVHDDGIGAGPWVLAPDDTLWVEFDAAPR